MVLLLAACAAPFALPEDGHPARRTASPDRRWEAIVDEAGVLRLRPFGDAAGAVIVAERVDRRVAFSTDTLVYAQDSGVGETDLWAVALSGGTPTRLTDWLGSEDRPVWSPDGATLAFVGSPGGIPGWWTLDRATGEFTQLTNLHGREGFEPVPDGPHYAWGADGLRWVAGGRAYTRVPR